ncbi:hypothetical protein ACFL35_01175 [Candidatus Riflebacteria bacterium]
MNNLNIRSNKGLVERYLMRKEERLYFSFYTSDRSEYYSGNIVLSHLKSGENYEVHDVVKQAKMTVFQARTSMHKIKVEFQGSLILQVRPVQ